MPQHHDVVVEIQCVELREGAARTQQREDLHRLRVLHLALARHGDSPSGEQRIAGDHGGDDPLVVVARSTLVIIGHRPQPVRRHQAVEGHRRARRTLQLRLLAFGRHLESCAELRDLARDLRVGHPLAQGMQLAHFEQFDVRPEDGRLAREVGIYVEHPPVVVSQYAEPVPTHTGTDARSGDPLADLPPGDRIVEPSRHEGAPARGRRAKPLRAHGQGCPPCRRPPPARPRRAPSDRGCAPDSLSIHRAGRRTGPSRYRVPFRTGRFLRWNS